jgi:hypothetical protein
MLEFCRISGDAWVVKVEVATMAERGRSLESMSIRM